ncbi:MAG: CPBP family intramembrane glutamic endopeptidase [Phycisphaerales bacterium]
MATRSGTTSRGNVDAYGNAAKRPLHVLAFLLPLIGVYEYGAVRYLPQSDGVTETIGAHSILLGLFQDLGPYGRFIPTALMILILLLWHVMKRDPWKVRPMVLLGMLAESMIWTLPLWVFSLLAPLHPNGVGSVGAVGATGTLLDLSWQARVTLSAGAGLYEELLFRVLIITATHFLVVDLLRQASSVGFVIGGVVSSLAFALYHRNIGMPGGGVHLGLMTFYTLAGVYFSVIFVSRGFGIAVMTHAMYDVVVLVVQPGLADSSRGGG